MSNAFPIYTPDMPIEGGPGLTKRELFAAMAMQGCCANSIPGSHHGFTNTASEAVAYADALIAELAKVQS